MRSREAVVHPITPREAVADAMMAVQARYINNVVGRRGNNAPRDETELQLFIDSESAYRCKPAAVDVVRILSKNNPRLFDQSTVIESWHTSDFPYHALFLVHGVNDVWYAGSASNNDTARGRRRFSTIYESKELDVVLDIIKRYEGGEWPSSEDVMESIKKEKSRHFVRKLYDRYKPISYRIPVHSHY